MTARNRRWLAVPALAAAVAAGGCQDGVQNACTPSIEAGLVVFVVNDLTGGWICDAVVTARDDTYVETLARVDAYDGGCRYHGALERPGTYALRAEAAGFLPSTVPGVRVRFADGGCHVEAARTTIRLSLMEPM